MTPSKIKEGQIFGHWKVIKFDHTNQHRIKYYLCECQVCGTIRPVRASALLNGTSTSCSKSCSLFPAIGSQWGDWTVLARDGSRTGYMWCRCKCGKEMSIKAAHLKIGMTKSCGCNHVIPKEKRKHISSLHNNVDANEELAKILDKYNISFKREYRFEDCRNKAPLPFDFAIFNKYDELIGLIENNGEQHYSSRGMGWFTPERVEYIQKNDYIKQKFAEDNQIPLLIIPYQYFDELEKFLITSDFWNVIIKNFND